MASMHYVDGAKHVLEGVALYTKSTLRQVQLGKLLLVGSHLVLRLAETVPVIALGPDERLEQRKIGRGYVHTPTEVRAVARVQPPVSASDSTERRPSGLGVRQIEE